jgi:RsiW-degrading membrane proteinase PrsW (M82 family)
MVVVLALIVAAVAPAVFLMYSVYVRDKYEREPLGLVVRIYLISMLTVIPAVILELAGSVAIEQTDPGPALAQQAVLAFLVIALAEEGTKLGFLLWLAYRRAEFNEVYDGIVYAVAVGLGFATTENIFYVLAGGSIGGGIAVAVFRAFTAVPGHALWGVMLGYFVGLAKFTPDRRDRWRLTLTGLGLAVFMHGLYDFFLLGMGVDLPTGWLAAFALGVLLVLIVDWVIGLRLIRAAQMLSPFRRPGALAGVVPGLAPAVYCIRCGVRALRPGPFCGACGAPWEGT